MPSSSAIRGFQPGRTGPFPISVGAPQVRFTSSPVTGERAQMQGTASQMIEDLGTWQRLGVSHLRLRVDVSDDAREIERTMRRVKAEVLEKA